jgi:hypothetical protein
MAILLRKQTLSRISRLINETAVLVNRTQTLAEKNSMISVARQRALGNAGMTMPRIGIAVRTTARIESGIGAVETTATQGVVAETLHRIAAATPRREWTITRSARRMRETRRAVKTPREDTANSLPIRRGIDQTTVSILKLTGQTINCCLPLSLTLRVTLAYLAYMSMSCLA